MTKASEAKSKETKQSLFATQTDASFSFFILWREGVGLWQGRESRIQHLYLIQIGYQSLLPWNKSMLPGKATCSVLAVPYSGQFRG